MEDRKHERRYDTGSTFPLRTSTNQPTRSMGSAAVPVLMKSSSTKSLLEEVSEKRRRECMSQQLRGPSLPSKTLLMGALGGSKAATASDLPTITGKKPLPRALLPKEARKTSYQPVISGLFAFSSGGLGAVTTGPASVMQRRSSISSCYPLRPSAVRHERVISNGTDPGNRSTEKKPQTANDDDALWRLSLDRARRNSVNTLSPSPTDVPSQISLSRGRTSGGGGGVEVAAEKQNVDTESIYPMLRMAFGKDENDDDDSSLIRRNPGRQGVGKRERPVSYADPHSFRQMQEDLLQTPEYIVHPQNPPSYDPPSEPTKTSFDTNHAIVRSESSYVSYNTPDLQDHNLENASNSTLLPTSIGNSNNRISEDQTRVVSRQYDEVKPQPRDILTMKRGTLSPSTKEPKPHSPISTKLDEISPNAKETEIKSPVRLQSETISPCASESNIQSPSASKREAISANPAGSNREDWYSPIPASPRRVLKSPLLSSESPERAEIYSPAYRNPSTFEIMRKPRPLFSFDVEDSTNNRENDSYTKSSEADQNIIAEDNNNKDTPPELPSSAPPPLPLTSIPSDGPGLPHAELRHTELEYNSTPGTIPEDLFSKLTRNKTTVETVPPTLPASVPPPLSVTPPPTSVSDIFSSGVRHPDLENGSRSHQVPGNCSSGELANDDNATADSAVSELSHSLSPSPPATSHPIDATIIAPPSGIHNKDLENSSSPDKTPEIHFSEPTNDCSMTIETVPPALPSSNPPPLPIAAPPTIAPSISPFVVHHKDLEHISSSETGSHFNEAVEGNVHGATAERSNDELEHTEYVSRQQRHSLSSEESLLEGQETKSCSARNRETLSPTLSDADSGIDCVKLEQKRNYELSMTTEEYQTALWDEQIETATGKIDIAVPPVSNDRNKIIDDTAPDVTLSTDIPAAVEPQETIRNASDCVVMSSSNVPLTPIETGSKRNEESVSNKTITPDKESEEDKSAFTEDAKNPDSDALPLDLVAPPPSEEDQRVTVPSEVSEKSDVTSVGQRNVTTVHIHKGIMGLGFSVQGGKGSAYGDKPITVKKIFKAGDATVKEVLTMGDELISANGKNLTNCSLHEAWNYLKTLPDGTIDLVIGKASDL